MPQSSSLTRFLKQACLSTAIGFALVLVVIFGPAFLPSPIGAALEHLYSLLCWSAFIWGPIFPSRPSATVHSDGCYTAMFIIDALIVSAVFFAAFMAKEFSKFGRSRSRSWLLFLFFTILALAFIAEDALELRLDILCVVPAICLCIATLFLILALRGPDKISDKYKLPIWVGFVWFSLLALWCGVVLDMGESANSFLCSLGVYIPLVVIIILRRPVDPTKLDLLIIKWSLPMLFFVGLFFYPFFLGLAWSYLAPQPATRLRGGSTREVINAKRCTMVGRVS